MADQLAARIKDARKEAKLSREQVAAALGVSLSTVVRWETGRTKRISLDTLLGIASATGHDLGYFMSGGVAA